MPHGLYDVSVVNPDGQRVTEPYRYLVERAIEADVTIGIGGARTLNPGDAATYSVSLQSLTNVDTPYVRFDIGATDMGNSADVLAGLNLPLRRVLLQRRRPPRRRHRTGLGQHAKLRRHPDDADHFNHRTTAQRPPLGVARRQQQTPAAGNLAPGYAFDLKANGFRRLQLQRPDLSGPGRVDRL